MKSRDTVALSALRSALAAIDNAEAADLSTAPAPVAGTIAGGAFGLGAGEVDRIRLSGGQVEALLRGEVSARRISADDYDYDYDRFGQPDRVSRLRAEAEILATAIAPSDPTGT